LFLGGLTGVSTLAQTVPVTLNVYADDYGTLSVDGTLVGSYDNTVAAGNIIVPMNLTPGWHSIAIDYANRVGTNALGLTWLLPGTAGYSTFPLANLRSLNQSGNSFISGLHADYYSSLGGSFLFTVFGEGPILNAAAANHTRAASLEIKTVTLVHT
jgi:hypothetical protein